MTHSNLNSLIDGDILTYRCGFAADSQARKELLPDEGKGMSKEEIREALDDKDYLPWALANVKTILTEITDNVFPDSKYYKLYLSGEFNFREQLATLLPYKGNRDEQHKPKYYAELKEYMKDVWKAEVIDGMEADDQLGIDQWAAKDKSTCIVSIDKDLDMIPGWHYNWVKREMYYLKKPEADLNLFCQMIEGDRTDNIPGIVGCGATTIRNIFDNTGGDLIQFRDTVRKLYQRQYSREVDPASYISRKDWRDSVEELRKKCDDWEAAYKEVGALLWIFREQGKACPFL